MHKVITWTTAVLSIATETHLPCSGLKATTSRLLLPNLTLVCCCCSCTPRNALWPNSILSSELRTHFLETLLDVCSFLSKSCPLRLFRIRWTACPIIDHHLLGFGHSYGSTFSLLFSAWQLDEFRLQWSTYFEAHNPKTTYDEQLTGHKWKFEWRSCACIWSVTLCA